MIIQILQCVSSLTCSTLNCLTDVCLKVSDVRWRVSDSHGNRLHGVQHPAVDSWAEYQLPVGGSRDQRGHLGHRPVGLRLLGTYKCVMWSVCVTHVPRPSPNCICVLSLWRWLRFHNDFLFSSQVLLGARAFVQSSKTRGCCAFRSQVSWIPHTQTKGHSHHKCLLWYVG